MATVVRPDPTAVPPLHDGERLSRAEFEHRYHAMPEDVRAELVEGVVCVMASPVRHTQHARPHLRLGTWLGTYAAFTPGVDAGNDGTVRLDARNEPQPDAYLFIAPERGGQARIAADGYVEGAPELVAEVAASSAGIDLGDKLVAYRRNGVREYLVWRVQDRALDWFVLRGDRYEPMKPGDDGLFRSETFPGLWLDAGALLADDLAAALAALQRGLASPEHAAFVDRLKGAAG